MNVLPAPSFDVPFHNQFRVTLLTEPRQLGEVFRRTDRLIERFAETRTGVALLQNSALWAAA